MIEPFGMLGMLFAYNRYQLQKSIYNAYMIAYNRLKADDQAKQVDYYLRRWNLKI